MKKLVTLFAVTAMFLATASVYAQAPWTPEFTNTVAWFDANDSGTLWEDTGGTIQATNSGAVARMDDKSGNARHMTQSTAIYQPSVSNNYLYGEEFGIHQGEWMRTADYSGQSSNLMLFIVAKVTGADNGSDALWALKGAGSGNLASTAGASGVFRHQYSGLQSVTSGNDYFNQLATFQINLDYDDTGKIYVFVDAVESASSRTYTSPLDSDMKLHLFTSRDANRPLGGLFGEWVLVDGVETNLEDQIQGYLAWKWDGINGDTALVDALPIGHPYKVEAPLAPPPVGGVLIVR